MKRTVKLPHRKFFAEIIQIELELPHLGKTIWVYWKTAQLAVIGQKFEISFLWAVEMHNCAIIHAHSKGAAVGAADQNTSLKVAQMRIFEPLTVKEEGISKLYSILCEISLRMRSHRFWNSPLHNFPLARACYHHKNDFPQLTIITLISQWIICTPELKFWVGVSALNRGCRIGSTELIILWGGWAQNIMPNLPYFT